VAEFEVPGLSLVITSADRIRYAAGYGSASLTHRRPALPDTRYLWFSLTKIVTATATLRLVDEGRIGLDTPVRDFVAWPGFDAEPTVGQLLDHTAGLANPLPVRWVRPIDRPARPELLDRLAPRHRRLRRPAGVNARYSNLGYLLLAEVIAAAAGEPFEQHVDRAVLRPAGMRRTTFAHDPSDPTATGYVGVRRPGRSVLRAALPAGTVERRHGRHVALRPFVVDGAGYGGLIGPATDVARLARLHLGDGTIDHHRVLAPTTASSMRHITALGRPFDHGHGWARHPHHRTTTPSYVEHLGGGGGFYNALRLYPTLDLAIITMANTTRPYDHHRLFTALAELH
jgi:CubicO group peptidase (beta-lactamase class C family)